MLFVFHRETSIASSWFVPSSSSLHLFLICGFLEKTFPSCILTGEWTPAAGSIKRTVSWLRVHAVPSGLTTHFQLWSSEIRDDICSAESQTHQVTAADWNLLKPETIWVDLLKITFYMLLFVPHSWECGGTFWEHVCTLERSFTSLHVYMCNIQYSAHTVCNCALFFAYFAHLFLLHLLFLAHFKWATCVDCCTRSNSNIPALFLLPDSLTPLIDIHWTTKKKG